MRSYDSRVPTFASLKAKYADALGGAPPGMLSSAPVLRTFDSARRTVWTTDASNIAVAGILTPDDEGRQHPVAHESRKLTAAERNYPALVLELLAVVHAPGAFRPCLLGGGAPRPEGCWSDSD